MSGYITEIDMDELFEQALKAALLSYRAVFLATATLLGICAGITSFRRRQMTRAALK
jgi:hypothetical protein